MSTLKKEPDDSTGCPWLDTGPHGNKLKLEDYPSALLMRVANRIQADVTSVYARQHELSVPEWRLLARLHESAPMQLTALCRTSYFDKAYAGRILRDLEARGLAHTQADAAHRRRLIVDITPEGRALARKVVTVARRSQARLLDVLTRTERAALYETLHKLLNATSAAAPEETS